MTSDVTKRELEDFYGFVGQQLRDGGSELTPEQVLGMWRERVETIRAIQEGLADVEAGRVRPATDVLDELRAKLGSPRD